MYIYNIYIYIALSYFIFNLNVIIKNINNVSEGKKEHNSSHIILVRAVVLLN